jgi:hypothetical protein
MSAAPAAPLVEPAEPVPAIGAIRLLLRRTVTLCLLELAKLRHDRTELYTRAVQPALWLLVFGETFTRIHAIPTTPQLPYLDYLAPGIMAQSALFIAIFYGIQLIWERDFGILTKLLATPTPRAALVTGKAFAAGVRAIGQVLGDRPGHHHAAVLRLQRAVPDLGHAGVGAGHHPRQPAQLRGQRPPPAAARPGGQPRRGLRRAAAGRRRRDRGRLAAARAAHTMTREATMALRLLIVDDSPRYLSAAAILGLHGGC